MWSYTKKHAGTEATVGLTMLSFSSMLRTPPLSKTGIRLMANTAALSGGMEIFGPKKT